MGLCKLSLLQVVLVHGHWYYYRVSLLVQYFFYKVLYKLDSPCSKLNSCKYRSRKTGSFFHPRFTFRMWPASRASSTTPSLITSARRHSLTGHPSPSTTFATPPYLFLCSRCWSRYNVFCKVDFIFKT